MWNLASLGYAPLKLVLGTAVYSLGLIGGFKAMLKSFVRGEISSGLITLVLLAMAAFVAYQRHRVRPIAPRRAA